MSPSHPFLSAIPLNQLFVWVLAPHLESKDANIDYYYDFSQSIAEYTRTFNELDVPWKWQPVTITDYPKIINRIAAESAKDSRTHIVFNLCDGDEVNGTPGISVVKLLEEKGLIYTGADEYFYRITTSKIPMKRAFDEAGVPNAPWEPITSREQNLDGLFDKLGSPLIVKPSVSGGSMGVGVRNVVSNVTELKEQVENMFKGYRGWELVSDGIVAESFINGPEYTVLIAGSYDQPEKAKVYDPVERIFHPSLPDKEKFLSFDRLWEIYEEEEAMPNQGNFYEYALPDASLIGEIKKLSRDAYVATKGRGYTRVDLRMDKETGKIFVLEVNAQCGLSEDEDYTSIGAILRLNGKTFTQLVVAIINDAYQRKKTAARSLKHKGSLGI
ncbi:MAG: hypothetical protein IPI66_10335 [Chitinophagaceae bacterium]|nr:hypothetical protein [Chitinophagaceae bacterium]